jgi:nucleotide sugar dehydrogenase
MDSITVVGIGKLGLYFARYVSETSGINVIGVDSNESYVENLKTSEKIEVTTDLKYAVSKSKYIFILVQTPETETSYDHTILKKVIDDIQENYENRHIIVNSTVMPGFHNSIVMIKGNTLSYNPAFVAQGTVMEDYRRGGKFGITVIGTLIDEVSSFLIENIYRDNTKVHVMSPQSAEVFKIADNTFRVMKISYTNMISDLCKKTDGAVPEEVANALKNDESIGSICMTPGFCYGGPCYPRDIKALCNYVKSKGFVNSFLSGIIDSNEEHHAFMLQELLDMNNDEYIFDSVSYKEGTDLTDNSPTLRLVNDLRKVGRIVSIKDS